MHVSQDLKVSGYNAQFPEEVKMLSRRDFMTIVIVPRIMASMNLQLQHPESAFSSSLPEAKSQVLHQHH